MNVRRKNNADSLHGTLPDGYPGEVAEAVFGAGWHASTGHTSAQAPHSVQSLGSIMKGEPSAIAPSGHSGMQTPHAMQSSSIW